VVWNRVRDWWAAAPRWARLLVSPRWWSARCWLPTQSIGSFMTPRSDWPTVLFYPIGIYILLAIGLNVVVGQAGLLDLGYVAFFAIGGYFMAVLGTKWGWNFWEILVVGVAGSALSGVILGAPTLRLRGDYLAIVTLGFARSSGSPRRTPTPSAARAVLPVSRTRRPCPPPSSSG